MGNILIVDDEPAVSNYLSLLIGELGHQAEKTQTAAETLAKLKTGVFHLIIADILLPDAAEPQEWIRSLTKQANGTPIVLISGSPSRDLTDCAKQCGVLAFLSKPFELAFLKNILKNVFGN